MGNFPNKETQFKPGQSGNPNGRPKGAEGRAAIAKKWLSVMSEGENIITRQHEELTEEDWQFLSLVKQGRRGNVKAIEMLFEMLYGPIEKKLEHGGNISLEQITGHYLRRFPDEDAV